MRFVSIFVSWGFSQSWRCDLFGNFPSKLDTPFHYEKVGVLAARNVARVAVESTLKRVVLVQPVWLTGGLQKHCGSTSHRLMKLNPHRWLCHRTWCQTPWTEMTVTDFKMFQLSILGRIQSFQNMFKAKRTARSGKVRDVPGASCYDSLNRDEVWHRVSFYTTLKHCSFCY